MKFVVTINPPSTSDNDDLDSEQIQRWIQEHRPRHEITVDRQDTLLIL